MAKRVLADNLSAPLDGAKTVRVDINVGTGNLTIDRLTDGEPVLATGTMEYYENQRLPTRTVSAREGEATLTLKSNGTGRQGIRLPWAACNGGFEWRIHLNPSVRSDITAHSDGGNVKLDLAGMAVAHVVADTGGGNVAIRVPSGVAARICARTGLGKVIVDPRFSKSGKDTFQSSDYDSAAIKLDVRARSGAGNVTVEVG